MLIIMIITIILQIIIILILIIIIIIIIMRLAQPVHEEDAGEHRQDLGPALYYGSTVQLSMIEYDISEYSPLY